MSPRRVAPENLRPGDLPVAFGRYQLLEILGEGGMARVFRAELQGPAGFTKQMAVKVIKGGDAKAQERAASLIAEARIGALLHHTNIVDTYDLGQVDGHYYIALELVEGVGLFPLVRHGGRLPGRALLDLGVQMCAGLAHAHDLQVGGQPANLVHRDLKLSNVLLTAEGVAKIADFGIAQAEGITAPEQAGVPGPGTLSYMSPEQLHGAPLDARSDIFAMGSVLYTAATARGLFHRPTANEMMLAILDADSFLERSRALDAVDIYVPGLNPILRRCLRVDVAERYATVRELGADLLALLAASRGGPMLAQVVRQAVSEDASEAPMTIAAHTAATVAQAEHRKTNLGMEMDQFVGRGGELSGLEALVGGQARLVTLTGPGGVGKTRLARHFAVKAMQRYVDEGGVWFCDLSVVRSLAGVLGAVTAALGLDLVASPDTGDLAAKVGSALSIRGPTLVVLDNFEHVSQHAALTVGRWLESAPQVRFVVTSRERLKLPGEQVVDLLPMSGEEAVELFCRRAKAGPARFEASDADIPHVRAIVDKLDGIPLAVELAAARIGAMTPEQLALRLTRSPGLLGSGEEEETGSMARHATLRAAIAWSWGLLEPWEQDTLAQLSVFRGGFTMEAIEGIVKLGPHVDAPWAMFVIESLLDKSLLRTYEAPGLENVFRFDLYSSIQAFAAERLADPEAIRSRHGDRCSGAVAEDLARERHARWFAELGSDDALEALDSQGGEQGRRRLALEAENLVVANQYAVKGGDRQVEVKTILASVAVAEHVGGTVNRMSRMCETALASGALGRGLHLRLLLAYSRLLLGAGYLERARDLGIQAGRKARGLDDKVREGEARGLVARIDHKLGKVAQARKGYNAAVALLRSTGSRRREGEVLRDVAYLCAEKGRLDQADRLFKKALEAHREVGNRAGEAQALDGLAKVQQETGHPGPARELYRQALARYRQVGNRKKEGIVLANLANTYREQGRMKEAQKAFEDALSIHREVGDRPSVGILLTNFGSLLQEQGELDQARKLYEDALVLHRQGGLKLAEGVVLGNLGDLLLQQDQLTQARLRLVAAVKIFAEIEDPIDEGVFLGSLAEVRARTGNLEGARADVERGEALLRESGLDVELAKLLCRKGRIALAEGKGEEAWACLDEAGEVARSAGMGRDSELAQMLRDLRRRMSEQADGRTGG